MEKLQKLLGDCLNSGLVRIIISNCRKPGMAAKVVVKPFEDKGTLFFQFAEYRNKQVFHTNLEQSRAGLHIITLLKEQYKQMEISMSDCRYTVLVSKKGKVTIKKIREEKPLEIQLARGSRLTHNRKKEYVLPENEPVPFLVKLGVQTKEGKIIDKKYKKFRQINRFLEFVRDVLPALPKNRRLTIIDFGCGKSYLTFAMYYYLKIMNGYDVQMVVTLHACDTATDYALDKAIRWKAKVILSVPCCQHEINQKIQSEVLQPVLKYGILKERIAALLTDGVRANLLEEKGYSVQILEFIDMEHTPKNLLIRAVYSGKNCERKEEYDTMRNAFNLHGTFEFLLDKKGDDDVE